MFFTGSLQSGIALALQQARFVVCLLVDDSDESKRWQEVYLANNEVKSTLHAKAVVFRLESNSQEAAWLRACYPVNSPPALVVIHNGEQLLDLRGGVTREQFRDDILRALRHPPSASSPDIKAVSEDERVDSVPSSSASHTSETEGSVLKKPEKSQSQQDTIDEGNNPASSDTLEGNNRETTSLGRLMARQKLEKARREEAAAQKTGREPSPENRDSTTRSSPVPVKVSAREKQAATYAEQQRQKKKETQRERERVLGQIEQDKQGRREREERLRATARSKSPPVTARDTQPAALWKPSLDSLGPQQCGIQVRLRDGTQIRHKFSPNQTIASDVRPWIEQKRLHDDTPYTLKHILSPLPHRPLTDTEEKEALADLGLMPNASLILVPVSGSASAYSEQPGALTRFFRAVYDVLAACIAVVAKMLGMFLGVGLETHEQRRSEAEHDDDRREETAKRVPEASSSGLNIRTLYDQRKEKDGNEFYNGNQLNFEPRKDEDDNKG